MAGKIVFLKKSHYEELDANEQRALANVRQCFYASGTNAPLCAALYQCFSEFNNPFVIALKLSYCCGDFHSSKSKSLAVFVIMKFSEWLKEHMIDPLVDVQLKLDALRLVLEQKNNSFRDIVIRVFNMTSNSHEFIPFISELIQKNKYKEACQVANSLKLQGYFPFEDFLLPLCVLDKTPVVEDFVSTDERTLHDFLTYLDDLLSNDTFDRVSAIMREKSIPNWDPSKCGHKPFIKLMARLIKKYNVPTSLCPNMEKRRKRSAMHYLLAKRFESHDGGGESWEEMVMEAVGDCSELHSELVESIFHRGEVEEALHWATLYKLPEDDWPEELRLLKSNSSPAPSSPEKKIDKNSQTSAFDLFKLPFTTDKIILVDSNDLFSQFMERMRHVDIVALDTEWKPSLFTQNALSLIQVATHNEVFIIDRLVLAQSMEDELVSGLVDGLFHNKNIIKIGFDFHGDKKALRAVLPGLKEVTNLVDMTSLRRVLKDKFKFNFPFNYDASNENSGGKLKNLIEMCFNKTLDKTEQCSNWERRPLRAAQLEYAALDAYCLIEAYELIKKECAKQEIDFNELSSAPEQEFKAVHITDLHFICTWELALLYKRLRRCGINTIYNDARQPSKRNLKLMRNGYIVVTSVGQPWLTSAIRSYQVPLGDERSQLSRVLEKYQVVFDEKNTTARCTECNETNITEIPTDRLRRLQQYWLKPTHSSCMPDGYGTDENDDEDFSGDEYDEPEPAAAAVPVQAPAPDRWTDKGAVIQADLVPERMFQVMGDNDFYVCQSCGHVLWPTTFDDMFLYG